MQLTINGKPEELEGTISLAFVVECNLDPTPNSSLVDLAIQGKAKDIVPQLLS